MTENSKSGFSVSEAEAFIFLENIGNANEKYKKNWKWGTISKIVPVVLQDYKQTDLRAIIRILYFFFALYLVPKLTVLSLKSETSIPGTLCKHIYFFLYKKCIFTDCIFFSATLVTKYTKTLLIELKCHRP